MAILIEEVTEEPGCAGCGCISIAIPIVILYLFRESIINGIVTLLAGVFTVLLWLIGITLVIIGGYYLLKYILKESESRKKE